MIKLSEYTSISSKGQKIIAALFLVTGHLPETDPMRLELRDLAVQLASDDGELRRDVARMVMTLLGAASLARIVSDANARIIEAELKYFIDSPGIGEASVASLFPLPDDAHKGQFLTKRTEQQNMSFIKKTTIGAVLEKRHISIGNKNNRQEKILSYINERKSANIKDIASLFPDVSEKTIQRELGVLVTSGKIRKHGNKRWSLYLAISS
jgi:hypothetical protein